MTIKEVEQELGVPRATIRYYEKENLIVPQRSENGYREYSEADVVTLKRIIILRKLGLGISDIAEVFDGAQPLATTVEENVIQLQRQVKELHGAIRICKQLQGDQVEINTFDTDFYWDEIHQEELQGSRFMDIAGDVIQHEKKLVWKYFDLSDEEGNLLYNVKESVLRVLGLCVFMGLVDMALYREWKMAYFMEGFSYPFTLVLIYSAVELPLYLLSKRHANLVAAIRKTGKWICIVLFLGIALWVLLFQIL